MQSIKHVINSDSLIVMCQRMLTYTELNLENGIYFKFKGLRNHIISRNNIMQLVKNLSYIHLTEMDWPCKKQNPLFKNKNERKTFNIFGYLYHEKLSCSHFLI